MALMQITDKLDAFSAYAQETISAGQFVKSVSDSDVVNASGVSSYAATDIAVGMSDHEDDDELTVGIALETATSGNIITIGTEGLFILAAQEDINTGMSISPGAITTTANPNECIETADTEEEFKIGKALTGASSGTGYFIALVRI